MKKILVFLLLFISAAILFSMGISITNSNAADSSKITIAYTGNLKGYTEPCG